MTLTGKQVIKRYLQAGNRHKNAEQSGWQLTGYYLQLLGGVVLVLLGFLLMSGQETGISPVFAV
ncbi:hypothetical protein JCM19237_4393 [Photobacterium aphoticum]|uniref:Uncharacterized protein n=1 Tax=Photobacterium aphoticum TaxID=754436 RepID=A0A090RBU9_9GAMM|nr:hypothetical protein JCM19237_4393 [Photobacterium aphoticum]